MPMLILTTVIECCVYVSLFILYIGIIDALAFYHFGTALLNHTDSDKVGRWFWMSLLVGSGMGSYAIIAELILERQFIFFSFPSFLYVYSRIIVVSMFCFVLWVHNLHYKENATN